MAYRLVYEVNIDWVGAGENVMSGNLATPLPAGGRGGAQTLQFSNKQGGQNAVGSGAGGALNAADITALVTAMDADITAQLTAALGRLATWPQGGG